MRLAPLLIAVIASAGCASQEHVWEKPGASQDEFHRDRGQCIQASFSATLATTMQQRAIFLGCMQGKGWYSVPVQR